MKKLLLCKFLIIAQLFCVTTAVWANSATDEIGSATTIYHEYLRNGLKDNTITLQTNLPGNSPDLDAYTYLTVSLASRLMPFSLNVDLSYYTHMNPTVMKVNFRGREWNDQNEDVQKVANTVVQEAKKLATVREQLAYVNQYIVDHCQYLTAALHNPNSYPTAFTSYGALVQGNAVCEGYANSFQLICEKLGITCVQVTGVANGQKHIWNSVYLNGAWYMVDVTFNDPINFIDVPQTAQDHVAYFLLTQEQFDAKNTHQYDNSEYEIIKNIALGLTTGQNSQALGEITIPIIDEPVDSELEAKAEVLKEKGLFVGDARGFRLNDTMIRTEMAVMIMRLSDGAQAITDQPDYYASLCPFEDVPQWALSAVGYAVDNQLIAGQTSTLLGGNDLVKMQDYAVIMLRLLDIDHTYETALPLAIHYGIISQESAQEDVYASRGHIVEMTYNVITMLEQV